MGLLKYIEMKGLGGGKLTDHEANILVRTQDEGGPLVVPVKETVSDDEKMHQQEPEVLGSCSKRRKLVKIGSNVVKDSSSSLDSPEKEEEDDDDSLRTGVETPGERSTKRRRKQIVFSESSESDSDHDKRNTVLVTPVSSDKRRSGKNKSNSEPGESSNGASPVPESDLQVLNQVGCLAQLVGSVPELVKSWYEKKTKREARLRDRVSRYRLRMKVQAAKNAKLVKKVKKLKNLKTTTLDNGQKAIRMLAKNTIEHKKVVEGLEKELEIARAQSVESEEKLKKAHEEIQLEKGRVDEWKQLNEVETGKWEAVAEGWRQERVSLEASLERVSTERKWLIEEGFGYVINRLHKSREYNEPLAAVQSNFWEWGAHSGLVKGYESCKDGVALEDVSLYKPQAHGKFLEAVYNLEHTRFPYVVALSQCTDRSLDELRALEPIGLEEGGD